MNNILLLDTSIGSFNKGDDIIMECTRKELSFLLKDNYELTLPTHVSAFHWYQVFRNSLYVQTFDKCKFKFVGGSNILIPQLLTHFPQWNINVFNYQPIKGSILVGVGAGQGAEGPINFYTRYIYTHLLNPDYYHSVRDERSKKYLERLGLKAVNTGCVTMWLLTPEFCRMIPTHKSDKVVFTLTYSPNIDERDQELINILCNNYKHVYFWPQGYMDLSYLSRFKGIDSINILQASKDAYDEYLTNNDSDYVGTRLHGGIYAMRHKRRAIILSIDERARAINAKNHLNCIEKSDIHNLEDMINSSFPTSVVMDFEAINDWKSQFEVYDV